LLLGSPSTGKTVSVETILQEFRKDIKIGKDWVNVVQSVKILSLNAKNKLICKQVTEILRKIANE
jgi:Cdc6-like AAA superfamily ATPase